MNLIEILDIDAPELAPFSKLTDHALRAKYEPEKGLFISESATVTGVALDAGFAPLSCLIQRNRIDTEKELLPFGAKLMSYMQTVRFFTDFLNGDTYYKIQYPEHNLVRTLAQLRLFEEQEKDYDKMREIIKGL